MNEYKLSKSRYCNGLQCKKMLWLQKHIPEEFDESISNQNVFDNGNKVGDTAMGLFGEYKEVPYSDNLTDMITKTEELIKSGTKNICEASFAYDNCFCSVDILKSLGNNEYEMYEVKSSTSLKDVYIDDLSYQYYVLTKLGYKIKSANIVYVNNKYIRNGKLELDRLFTIEVLTETASSRLLEVEKNIKEITEYQNQENEQECPIGLQCYNPYKCGFWHYCAKNIPEDAKFTVFDVAGLRKTKALELYNKGIITFEQLYKSDALSNSYKKQIETEVNNLPPEINKEEIAGFLKNITYPVYFLDFETFNPGIPLYDNTYPYQQIVFQYSLHYITEKGGKLEHKEFLAYPGEDPRRKLAEQLCNDIPLNVCTTAYNMTFEKTQIKALAKLYPDLSSHLMNIHDNIVDLMTPFQKHWYYSKEMKGSYSVKQVLPALYPNNPALNYTNLEGVQNGGGASAAFENMQDMTSTELEKWRQCLLKYCRLDTYAMVKILEKLEKIVQQS